MDNFNYDAIPIEGYLLTERFGTVPVLNIPLMSDSSWIAMCRKDFLAQFETEHGKQVEFPELDYKHYCDSIRRECDDLDFNPMPVVYYV